MGFIGNADNIRWGYFDLVPQATGDGYDIAKVPTKTNENTLYIPIANSLYMEEYKIEDLVNFLYQEADYFNNLPDGSKITHPSTLWYLEKENCLAINFASLSSVRTQLPTHFVLYETTKFAGSTTTGYYANIGIGIMNTADPFTTNALATTGEKHCEVFSLVQCSLSQNAVNADTYNSYIYAKINDSSGNLAKVRIKFPAKDRPDPDPNAFIDCNIGPVFHLDTDKECDHKFFGLFGTIMSNIDGNNYLPSASANLGAYPSFMTYEKKIGNKGELAVSVQARGTYIYMKNVSSQSTNIVYFMKYDDNNCTQVCDNNKWTIPLYSNSKIGGIKPVNSIIDTKKFALYYFGEATIPNSILLFRSAFIDLENNTTRYETFTVSYNFAINKISNIVKKFEGDITYVAPTADPFGIPSGKMFRFLMLTNGSLHGKKLWKYQSTEQTDFLTIYQSGSLYHGFTNPNNLQLTTGDLFEIREEIPMTICSFGPCGENATDPVKATTIQTGYRHIYMAIEMKSDIRSACVAHNYNYSQECIFGPYRSFNTVQNGHDFYLVKCLDLNKLETEFGYVAEIKISFVDFTSGADAANSYILGNGIATPQMIGSNYYGFCQVSKSTIKNSIGNDNAKLMVMGATSASTNILSSNYLSKYCVIGSSGIINLLNVNLINYTERPDKILGAGSFSPVNIEIYLQKV